MFIPVINYVRNVDEAFAAGLHLMRGGNAEHAESRNGGVTVWPGPVTTHTREPMERVLFNPLRKANPFFHLMESLWMLAGRNDLPWLTYFNKQMGAYSDDGGKTQPAAYGHRWRNFFGYDQIDAIVEELRRNPQTRRCVLAMWNPGGERDSSIIIGNCDLYAAINGSADVPCNTQCFFTIHKGRLHMGVTCRSNDLVWGAHGANAVHFSVLQEYIAARVGVGVGEMTQFSWNYHLYDGVLGADIAEVQSKWRRYYEDNIVQVTPIFHELSMEAWERDLPIFMDYASPANQDMDHSRRFKKAPKFDHPFLAEVAEPMLRTWDFYKAADLEGAASFAHSVKQNSDWQRAALEYMNRQLNRHRERASA